MILLIDAGNTRIKWAVLEGGRLSVGEPVVRAADADVVRRLAESWTALEPPQRILLANVAGDALADRLAAWARRAWKQEIERVVPCREAFGVTNAYTEPERLGVDRWLALIAARRRVAGPVCIVDCGTALTVDVMSAEGAHLGGLIIPGLGLMRRSLAEMTAGIGDGLTGGNTAEVSLFAKDTRGGVMGGTLYAVVAVIDRIMADVAEAMDMTVTCLLSGGDADAVLPLLAAPCRHVPDLVLEGLAVVAGGGS